MKNNIKTWRLAVMFKIYVVSNINCKYITALKAIYLIKTVGT